MLNDKVVKIELLDYQIYDGIHNLAIEYAISVDFIINVAIKRLLDDVELIRKLRAGDLSVLPIHRPNE